MAWRGPPQGRGAAVVATAGQARDRTRGVWGVQFDLCVCVMRESTSARWSLETSDETCGECSHLAAGEGLASDMTDSSDAFCVTICVVRAVREGDPCRRATYQWCATFLSWGAGAQRARRVATPGGVNDDHFHFGPFHSAPLPFRAFLSHLDGDDRSSPPWRTLLRAARRADVRGLGGGGIRGGARSSERGAGCQREPERRA